MLHCELNENVLTGGLARQISPSRACSREHRRQRSHWHDAGLEESSHQKARGVEDLGIVSLVVPLARCTTSTHVQACLGHAEEAYTTPPLPSLPLDPTASYIAPVSAGVAYSAAPAAPEDAPFRVSGNGGGAGDDDDNDDGSCAPPVIAALPGV